MLKLAFAKSVMAFIRWAQRIEFAEQNRLFSIREAKLDTEAKTLLARIPSGADVATKLAVRLSGASYDEMIQLGAYASNRKVEKQPSASRRETNA